MSTELVSNVALAQQKAEEETRDDHVRARLAEIMRPCCPEGHRWQPKSMQISHRDGYRFGWIGRTRENLRMAITMVCMSCGCEVAAEREF